MAAPAFGSIGTFTQTVAGTVSFPVPSGVASGDVVVIAMFLDSTATITAMPSGFAHAPSSPVSAGNHSLAVVWKRATGADTGTYDFTLSGSVYREGAAIRYTGCVASGTPWDLPTDSAAETTANTVTPAVNVTTLGSDRLVFFAATNWSGGQWTPPATFTERIDNPPNRTLTADDVVQAAAGSTGNVTATCAGSDRRTAWLGALMGTASGGTTHNADASLAVTATPTTAASVTRPAQASLSAAATLTTGATAPILAAASLAATATLTTAATRTAVAGASLSATATVTADAVVGVPPIQSAAALAVTASLTAAALRTGAAGASLSATATLTAAAAGLHPLIASLAVAASLAAGGSISRQVGASLAVTAALIAAAAAVGPVTAGTMTPFARSAARATPATRAAPRADPAHRAGPIMTGG